MFISVVEHLMRYTHLRAEDLAGRLGIASLIGLVLASIFSNQDIPPRKRYAWEGEDDGNGEHRSS